MHRLGHPEWADAAVHTNTWIGAFNTFVLLTSSFTAVLAHQAAERGTPLPKYSPNAAPIDHIAKTTPMASL